MERHKRTDHIDMIIGGNIDASDSDFNQPICPQTGFEDEEGYKEEVLNHWNVIRDSEKEGTYDMEIDKTLTPNFTYNDLEDMVESISHKLNHTL